ncbi:hypothetical protein D9M68_881630 [compost metagenome]
MREVEQVVADQQIGRVVVHVAGLVRPVGMVAGEVVGQQGPIGQGRVAHPDEDPLVVRDHGIGPHARLDGNALQARRFHADAAGIELEAVVAAAHAVAFTASARQRRLAVAAAVLHRDQPTLAGSIDEDRFVEHAPREHTLGGNLMFPCNDVPAISYPHACLHKVQAL